jgi:hypothetical protein
VSEVNTNVASVRPTTVTYLSNKIVDIRYTHLSFYQHKHTQCHPKHNHLRPSPGGKPPWSTRAFCPNTPAGKTHPPNSPPLTGHSPAQPNLPQTGNPATLWLFQVARRRQLPPNTPISGQHALFHFQRRQCGAGMCARGGGAGRAGNHCRAYEL